MINDILYANYLFFKVSTHFSASYIADILDYCYVKYFFIKKIKLNKIT